MVKRAVLSMVKKLRLIIAAPVLWMAFWKFENAWGHFSRDNRNKAEVEFEKGEKILRNIRLLDSLNPDHNIIKGYIKFHLSKYKESYSAFMDAWRGLDRVTYLEPEEKKYLKLYISESLRDMIEMGVIEKDVSVDMKSYADVNLKKVADNWKEKFPTRGHPEWDFEAEK